MYALRDAAGTPTNYVKVRDLGRKLGFNVGWSMEKGVSSFLCRSAVVYCT